MVGVSYGKNATLPDEQVRWLTPEEIEQRVEKGERIRFFDARDVMEYNTGSLPGAESLAQSSLMFAKQDVQPILDDLLANFSTYDVLIFFANTAGPNSGITSGRDVYVMAYLHELGVPLERMARLAGGLSGWASSGRPTPPSGALGSNSDARLPSLQAMLDLASLNHLQEPLAELTLEAAAEACLASRTAFLATLKDEYGVSKLAERQALCKALQKAVRDGRVLLQDRQ